MSYILDALKKADAERERGTVPGLHSHPLGQVDDDESEAPARPVAPAVWLGAGVGICLIAVLSWQLLSRPAAPTAELPAERTSEPAAPLQATPQAEQAMAPPATVPPAEPAYAPPALAQAPQPRPNPAPQAMAPAAQRATPAAPPLAITPSPATATQPAQVSANEAPRPAPPPAVKAPAQATTAPPATAARIPPMSELPDDIKRELPQLTIGGAMYSDTPSSRMLIINSQVFHEGDQPYQGLVLEEIRLKSAVFKFRGYRYAINY